MYNYTLNAITSLSKFIHVLHNFDIVVAKKVRKYQLREIISIFSCAKKMLIKSCLLFLYPKFIKKRKRILNV